MNARRHLTTAERGYGTAHQRERAKYVAAVNAGVEHCRRCERSIPPGGKGRCPRCGKDHRGWDLGHLDGSNKTVWTGPEHMCCNRATAGRRKHRHRPPLTARVQQVLRRSREW